MGEVADAHAPATAPAAEPACCIARNTELARPIVPPDMLFDVDTAYGRGRVTHPGRTIRTEPNPKKKKTCTNGIGTNIYGLLD